MCKPIKQKNAEIASYFMNGIPTMKSREDQNLVDVTADRDTGTDEPPKRRHTIGRYDIIEMTQLVRQFPFMPALRAPPAVSGTHFTSDHRFVQIYITIPFRDTVTIPDLQLTHCRLNDFSFRSNAFLFD